nr:hypothetical protein [Dyella sp. ASV24]
MRLDGKDKALRPAIYGLFAVLAAMCGVTLCVLGWKSSIPAMVLFGFMVVCASILCGLSFILWGWWKAFRTKSN